MMRRGGAAALAAAALLLFPGLAPSQPLPRAVVQERAARPDQLFNWYYAAAYGTGAYKVGDETERAYRRSDALEKRRKLMQAWADYVYSKPADKVTRLRLASGSRG